MASKLSWTPWHKVVALRDDVRTSELSLASFAADLYDVVMQAGKRPIYEDPAQFFALTYPTLSLRGLAKDVAHRLAGKNTKAIRQLELTYGGGKTHTLITLRHLAHDPAHLPDLPAVEQFRAHIGLPELPRARVAALCFDKLDVEKGTEVRGPGGELRQLLHPWSVLAFQLAGAEGLRLLHADGADAERETPPAEPLLIKVLEKPQTEGLATLVLVDEVLVWVREKVGLDPIWRDRAIDFFQYLTQAVAKVDHAAIVASLLASDPAKSDDKGRELARQVFDIFSRQKEEGVMPVQKEDVAEVLRRRFFTPESVANPDGFRAHAAAAVGHIAELDEQTKKARAGEEKRFLDSYPFHPDLTETFYVRWTQLERFQKARGILRTFAIALRDAESWDDAPLVGPNVLLAAPGREELAEAAAELTNVASYGSAEGKRQQWDAILASELAKARAIEAESVGLRHRELEQAVIATFLASQPPGQKAQTTELIKLVGPTRPDRIELEKALRRWAEISWFLDEADVASGEMKPDGSKGLPRTWRLGDRPNLRQMHHDAMQNRVSVELVEQRLLESVAKVKDITAGAVAAGAKVHLLPSAPRDVEDDREFHFAVLGPAAASESGKPSSEARRFLDETTGPDKPRVTRNAILLAVPSRDGLDAARRAVREHLAWEDVQDQLKKQDLDIARQQMLAANLQAAAKRVPEAIRQAWSIVVTVSDANEAQAFKLAIGSEPLFATIKSDKRARLQDVAINAETLLPGGPYDLWREGESARRVKDLAGAFAEQPRLPKMLRRKEVLQTVALGIKDGTWVGRAIRSDKSERTYWREPVEDKQLEEPSFEVVLPAAATLTELDPKLLAPGILPELWKNAPLPVADLLAYFAGGRTLKVPRDGWEEEVAIPKVEPTIVEAAIATAVERGYLWLTNGPASLYNEKVPAGVLTAAARLRPPPQPIAVDKLTPAALPDAWKDGEANALGIATALSNAAGQTLPWAIIRQAIEDAVATRWIELLPGGVWPCDWSGTGKALFRVPKPEVSGSRPTGLGEPGKTWGKAPIELGPAGLQDLADLLPALTKVAVGHALKFRVAVILDEPSPAVDLVKAINELLRQVDAGLDVRARESVMS